MSIKDVVDELSETPKSSRLMVRLPFCPSEARKRKSGRESALKIHRCVLGKSRQLTAPFFSGTRSLNEAVISDVQILEDTFF